MKLTAQQIADHIGGKLAGDGSVIITGAQSLADASAEDVSFLANPKYAAQLQQTKAAAVIVPKDFEQSSRTVIRVANPQLAFARVLALIETEMRPSPAPGVHPSAVVSPRARVSPSAIIGPLVVIEDDAVIGDRVRLMAQVYVGRGSSVGEGSLVYPQVTIREYVSVGKRAIIHAGAAIGTDGFGFVPTPDGVFKIPQIGRVIIEDDVEIGGNCSIDRATVGATRIGRGTKLDNLVHIAHNITIGEYCLIAAQFGTAGSTRIGNRFTVGGQAGTAGHISVGNNVTCAARTGVTASVGDNQILSGFPAQPHRDELKLQAVMRRLPELYLELKKIKEALKK